MTLRWSASTDDVAVTGYRIYRNGTRIGTVGASALTYTDATVSPSTTYTYQVSAVDAVPNESTKASVTATTPPATGGGTFTFPAAADTYVDSSQPTSNFGSASRLTVDNSPASYSLLRFGVTGTNGCHVTTAELRLTVGSGTDDKSPYGGDVYGTAGGWSEATVNWSTAPAAGAKVGSVNTAVALNATYFVDVTPLVTGDGAVNLLVKSTSSDGARYLTKESGTAATAPQLRVTC